MSEIPPDIEQTATRFAGKYLAHDISCERIYQDVVGLLVAERHRRCHTRRRAFATLEWR